MAITAPKFQQSENDIRRLHFTKPWEIYVAEPLVPQVDIGLDLLSFRKHCGAHIIGFEDKHPPFTAPLCDDFAFFFDELAEMCESNLHPMVDDLTE